jgi:hypothetical protein
MTRMTRWASLAGEDATIGSEAAGWWAGEEVGGGGGAAYAAARFLRRF